MVRPWIRQVAFAVDFAATLVAAPTRAAISHAAAFDEATGALGAVGRADYLAASPAGQSTMARYLMAVGWLETHYGYGWDAAGAGSNNMGAITGTWQGSYFEHADSRPDEDNDGQPEQYVTKFRRYPDRATGWQDLVRVVYRTQPVADAALRGDSQGFSRALHAARYYTGTSTDVAVNVERHRTAVEAALARATVELGPVPVVASVTAAGLGTSPSSTAAGGGLLIALGLGAFAMWRFRRR